MHHRVRVVVENWTLDGISRVEGPWRTVPTGMSPDKVCECLFRAALGDVKPVAESGQAVAVAAPSPP